MEAIPLGVFLMVLAAATVHAIWNFFARKVKGNLAVIYFLFFYYYTFLTPFTFVASFFTSLFAIILRPPVRLY